MSDDKKKVKCGTCGQLGHNKRTCPGEKKMPDVEPVELNAQHRVVYVLNIAEDNGDSVSRNMSLYASVDALMVGIASLINSLTEEHEDDDCDNSDHPPPGYASKIHYYSGVEAFKNVPMPAKDVVESVLDDKNYRKALSQGYAGLLVKIGPPLGSADGFGCEISVEKKTLNY